MAKGDRRTRNDERARPKVAPMVQAEMAPSGSATRSSLLVTELAEVARELHARGARELVTPMMEPTPSAAEIADALAPSPVDPKKARELMRQGGFDAESWNRQHATERKSERVRKAQSDLDAGVAALAGKVMRRGLKFTPAMYRKEHAAMVERWNAAVAHTRTMMRYCPECGAEVVGRHAATRFCSDRCKQRSDDREKNKKKHAKRKLREATGP